MNERWVCKRCFADNEDGASVCIQCGLTRGAEATPTDQASWTPAAEATAKRPAWQGLLRFWWIPLIAVVLLVGYLQAARRDADGSLTGSGVVEVQDLRVGDCFDSDAETEIRDVDGKVCTEPHEYEVFAVGDYGGAGDPYPSELEFDAAFTAICERAFEAYVGAPWDTSAIFASMITPSEESWDDGDREFSCILYEPVDPADVNSENKVLSESLRDAER